MSTKFVKLQLYEKNFAFTKTWTCNAKLQDPNKRKVGFSCFWLLNGIKMPWYSLRSFLFFCLEPKRCLDESDFRHCYGEFFESASLKVNFKVVLQTSNFILVMFKVPSQQLRGALTAAFWKTPNSWIFYRNESRYVLIFSSRLEQTWHENQRKCL